MTSSSATLPGALNTPSNRPGPQAFDAFEIALEIVRSLRDVVPVIRRRSAKLAEQIEAAASSIPANVAEGNRRRGKDRVHFFRIAAGSAAETRTHLQVAEAWGWIKMPDIQRALELVDRELAILWRLTE